MTLQIGEAAVDLLSRVSLEGPVRFLGLELVLTDVVEANGVVTLLRLIVRFHDSVQMLD